MGCQEVPEDKVSSYGIIRGEKTENLDLLKVVDMIEKPSIKEAPGRFAALGRYVITPEVLISWSRRNPARAVKSSSPMPSVSWLDAGMCMPIILPASVMIQAISWGI